VCERFNVGSPAFRYGSGLVDYPGYAYGVGRAAQLACALGHRGVTVVEIGVAGGNGLLALEDHALHYAQQLGIDIDVVAFDLGTGLPAPVDHRDIPFHYGSGDFPMDQAALRRRLRAATLIIGDVRSTIPAFLADRSGPGRRFPIGFVSFDLDYWSSTAVALGLFEGAPADLLPRVTCWFDDIVGQIEHIGQQLAIREFNERWSDRAIGSPYRLRSMLPFSPLWADRIYEAHFFTHPNYATDVPRPVIELPLTPEP
jgi:hypothetical protein